MNFQNKELSYVDLKNYIPNKAFVSVSNQAKEHV